MRTVFEPLFERHIHTTFSGALLMGALVDLLGSVDAHDELVALLAGETNIREVIAFPKTQSAFDPLFEAPSPIDEAQLAELGITVNADDA